MKFSEGWKKRKLVILPEAPSGGYFVILVYSVEFDIPFLSL